MFDALKYSIGNVFDFMVWIAPIAKAPLVVLVLLGMLYGCHWILRKI